MEQLKEGEKLKFKPSARSLFSLSDSSYLIKLKMTLLESCTEMLDLTNLVNFFESQLLEIMNLHEESK